MFAKRLSVSVSVRVQSRHFTSRATVLRQKSLVEKIRAAPGSRNDLSLHQSTSFFWQWLTTPSRKLLENYESDIIGTLSLSEDTKLYRCTVAGLHDIHLKSEGTRPIETPTLLVHGHAASGIMFHRSFENFSKQIKNTYAIDFPDTGLSDRRPLKVDRVKQKVELKRTKNDKDSVFTFYRITQEKEKNKRQLQRVEDYYVDAIEQWRMERNLEKFNLVSHSFGALMSFQYALRYPHRINKLVLCSPAGVERNIYSLNNTHSSGLISDDPSSPAYYRHPFVPSIIALLGFNITKALGPFGIQLISKFLSMRYSRGSSFDDQVKLLVKYTIALFHQRSNSYKNLKVVLTNQILARNPILDHSKELTVPTSIIYGRYDWMNSSAGYQLYMDVKSSGKAPVWFSVIENAGHNVFLDNHDEFDRQVLSFLKS